MTKYLSYKISSYTRKALIKIHRSGVVLEIQGCESSVSVYFRRACDAASCRREMYFSMVYNFGYELCGVGSSLVEMCRIFRWNCRNIVQIIGRYLNSVNIEKIGKKNCNIVEIILKNNLLILMKLIKYHKYDVL